MYAEVHEVIELSPTLLRVVLTGGTLDEFEASDATDAYINAQFLPENSPVVVPFEPEDLEGLDPSLRPRPRRFTIRGWDPKQRRLSIDFVSHGEEGYAGSWASRTKPGDRLQFKGPGGNYRPSPDVDWHLFVGDESALGAIGASLESLPSEARSLVFALVDSADHEIDLPSDADVTVNWLHRNTAADPETVLPEAVAGAAFLDGSFDVFVHGEAAEVRAVRQHLVADRGVDPDTASISPYWRRQHSDEDWRRIKRSWMTEQLSNA
ncbi:MAG: siderophore-interacting protein [Acidimicrobiales bacterium]